jgi:hypothetical protein
MICREPSSQPTSRKKEPTKNGLRCVANKVPQFYSVVYECSSITVSLDKTTIFLVSHVQISRERKSDTSPQGREKYRPTTERAALGHDLASRRRALRRRHGNLPHVLGRRRGRAASPGRNPRPVPHSQRFGGGRSRRWDREANPFTDSASAADPAVAPFEDIPMETGARRQHPPLQVRAPTPCSAAGHPPLLLLG